MFLKVFRTQGVKTLGPREGEAWTAHSFTTVEDRVLCILSAVTTKNSLKEKGLIRLRV